MSKKILIVDDEPDIVELLDYNLKKEGFEVFHASNGIEALENVKTNSPDVILLDVMMPQMDGIEACRRIRALQLEKEPYIMFLTARSEEFTEVAAWEAGGNDYIIKPIKPRALISRIKSINNLATNDDKNTLIIEIAGLKIDKSNYTVIQDNVPLSLPKKEFEILYLLAGNPNVIYNRDEILNLVWEDDTYVLSRTVDVHIRKLREKLGEDLIKTVKGVGYMFVV